LVSGLTVYWIVCLAIADDPGLGKMLSVIFLVLKRNGSQEEKEWMAKPPAAKKVGEGGCVGGWGVGGYGYCAHTPAQLFHQVSFYGGEGTCIKQFSIQPNPTYLSTLNHPYIVSIVSS